MQKSRKKLQPPQLINNDSSLTREATNESWQQPAIKDNVLNKHFYFNPGFSEDNLTDCYHHEAEVVCDKDVHSIWFDKSGECVLGLNKHNFNVESSNYEVTSYIDYHCIDRTHIGRVVNGLALDKNKHLVLTNINGQLKLEVINTSSTGGEKTWKTEGTLNLPQGDPIAICEVYRDAVGVLTNTLALQIYNRASFLESFSREEFHSIKLRGKSIAKASVKVQSEKLLLLIHDNKSVVEYNIHGEVLRTLPRGPFNKPCDVTTDRNYNTMVVCSDGLQIYMKNVWSHLTKQDIRVEEEGQIQKVCCNSAFTVFALEDILDTNSGSLSNSYSSAAKVIREEGNTPWFTKDHTLVLMFNSRTSDITEIHPHDANIRQIYHCADTKFTGEILHGVALNDDKHLVLIEVDDKQEVAMLHISSDEEKRLWKINKLLRYLKGIPLAMCEVQNDAVGMLLRDYLCLEIQIHKHGNFLGKKKNVVYIGLPHLNIRKASLKILEDEALVLNHKDNTVIEYNRQTKITNKLPPGSFYKPCSLITDKEGRILVVCAHNAYVLTDGKWCELDRPELCTDAGTEIRGMCCDSSYTILTVKTPLSRSKDNKFDYYCPHADIITDKGSNVWFTEGRKSVIVVDRCTLDLREICIYNKEATSVYPCSDTSVKGSIVNGLSLTDGKHVVLVSIYGKTEVAILHMQSEKKSTSWEMDDLWLLSGETPITLCEVDQDAVGILMNSDSSLELQIYKRNNFPGKRRDIEFITLPDQQIIHGSMQVIKDTLYLLNHDDLSVTEYNLQGEQTQKLPQGTFRKPCGLSSDIYGNLIVVCAKGLEIFKDKLWSEVSVLGLGKGSSTRIRQMCCDTSYTIFVTEDLLDTRTVPLVPLTPYGVRPATSVIQLPEKYHRLWSTSTSGVVAVGSRVISSISLVSDEGELLHTQRLGLKGYINSGVCLSGNQHAVIAKNGAVYSMRFVTIDTYKMNITLTDETCDVMNPITLFSVNSRYIGVLCSSDDTTQSHIDIVDKDSRVLKKTILIGYETNSLEDTACMCVNGYFYISSFEGGNIRMHDSDGTLLHTLGSKAEKGGADIPGQLYKPHTVLIDTDNSLLVQCQDGSVHKYTANVWSIVPHYMRWSWHIQYSGDHIYSVYQDKVCVNTIVKEPTVNKQQYTQDDEAGIKVTVCPIITPSLTHVTTKSLTQQYSRVWTDGEVLILGGCKHPTLTIVTSDFKQILSHTLCSNDEADCVDSGSHIRDTLHAVIVRKFGDINTLKLHIVNIDLHPSPVNIVRQLNVHQPAQVININHTEMAVLGFGEPGQPYRITLFRRDDLSEIRHIPVCYGAGNTSDRIYKSGTGDWYITSKKRNTVYRLTSDGVNLGPVTTPARDNLDTRPGYVWWPRQIIQDTNMDMLVVCNNGIIHRKPRDKDTDWEIVAETKQLGGTAGVWDICFIGEYMFTIYEDKLAKFKNK